MGKTIITINYKKKQYEVERGTLPLDIIEQNHDMVTNPVVGCCLEGSFISLTHPLEYSGTLEPIHLETDLGRRMYRRSLCFLFAMVAESLFPDNTLRIGHSLGDGFFFTFDEKPKKSLEEVAQKLDQELRKIVQEDRPITYGVFPYQEIVNHLTKKNLSQALQVLNFRNDATLPTYHCNDYIDISYEPLVASTALLSCFSICTYKEGLLLRYPRSNTPHSIAKFSENPLLYSVYAESKQWGRITGITSVGDVNQMITDKKEAQLIGMAELRQQRKINSIADEIHAKKESVRIVFVAGPSSSGKTTFVHKVALALQVLGIHPHIISLDNYYLPKKDIPKNAAGKPDLEALEALDLPLFQSHMADLLAGKSVSIPQYHFNIGDRKEGVPIHPSKEDIYLIEGIHGLNPKLSKLIPKDQQLRIFISALTQINLDGHNRISTTDNRLIRRMVRDNEFRGASPLATMDMWDDVHHGEKQYIFPYQNEADIAFNSSLDYELSVLRFFAEPLIREIKPSSQHYPRAMRLLTFLANFYPISAEHVPKNSILREFIGGLKL